MRWPLRRLKVLRAPADYPSMAPGDRIHRRRRALLAALAALTTLFSLVGGAPASASAPRYAGGDSDSGMPALPIVYPKTDTRTATRSSTVRFSDVDSTIGWAVPAIDFVAGSNDWMRDFAPNADGSYPFKPAALETRKYFARSLVKAFAPTEAPDGTIVFTDLDPSVQWYRWAAVAVTHGWMTRTKDGAFLPDAPVTMAQVHRALVLALGLRDVAKALDHLSTSNGVTFKLPPNFGTTLLGMRLSLRYNSDVEANDVGPTDQLSRAQVAYSLFRAKTQPPYNITNLRTQYATIELPFLGPRQQRLVRWGVKYVGYPYIWAGEWGLSSPEPSALGGQPRSGFDCSGLTWWLLRMNDDYAWKVAPPRPYAGWSLAQRGSADMARATTTRLKWNELRPGDLAFYDGNFDGTVDHVDTYIGNGYALDSSSTPGGVTIMWVGDGWYRDHFVFGRRIFG